MTKHNIEPVYNQDSRILILGSFPSVKSREAKFFYHHPQNRFWKVLAALFQEEVPQTIEEMEIIRKKRRKLFYLETILLYGMLLKVVKLKDQVMRVLRMLKSMI